MAHEYRKVQEEDHDSFPCDWYAVCWSNQLKSGTPMQKRLLGRDIVLFRDHQGQPQALHAYCPHRGADLSLGTCQRGLLQCPYHAWSFQGDGRCVEIPAHPERDIPSFAHTSSYPVMESTGLVWVYPQTNQSLKASETGPKPLQLFEDINDPELKLAPYEAIWNAHLTRVIESVLDVAHVPIVHRKTIGRKSTKDIHIDFEAEGDDIIIRNGRARLSYRFPQHWLQSLAAGKNTKFLNYVTFTPIDKEKTAIFGIVGRNFAKLPGISSIFSKYSSKVLEEDRLIVESQHPRPIPDALRMEAHVPADGPQVRFRQRWYQFLTGQEPRVRTSQTVK